MTRDEAMKEITAAQDENRRAILTGAVLRGANLIDADLTDADLMCRPDRRFPGLG